MKRWISIYLFSIIFFIILILYGSVLRHHYLGGTKFKSLQEIATFLASIPSNINYILKYKTITGDTIIPVVEEKFENKKIFEKKKFNYNSNQILLVSRHDGDLGRSVAEIRDINNFEILHSYTPDINELYNNIDMTIKRNKNLKKDRGLNRFYMQHPFITEKGDLIFMNDSPLFKINLKEEIIWVNEETIFHHSIQEGPDNKIYVCGKILPFSKKSAEYLLDGATKEEYINNNYGFYDDAIFILDENGKIIFSKSIVDILIDNSQHHRVFSQENYNPDAIHLNDIEPVLKDGPYYKKGDLFLSIRNLSIVILYRPENNKILKIIEGGFFNQHDVDILDEKTISIFNNNVFFNFKNERKVRKTEVILYNFENEKFSKKFEKKIDKLKLFTGAGGLVDFLKDGSFIIDDGRSIFLFDTMGDLVWEYNNLDKNNKFHALWWARIVDDEKSNKIKELLKND